MTTILGGHFEICPFWFKIYRRIPKILSYLYSEGQNHYKLTSFLHIFVKNDFCGFFIDFLLFFSEEVGHFEI